MDYEFRYQLAQAPEPRDDGTGRIVHDIWAVCREEGTENGWTPVGNYHKGVPVPTDELKAVLDMPDNTGAEKQAKNTAYKNRIAAHIGDGVVSVTKDWSKAGLELYMDTNDACLVEALRADLYLTVVLNQTYPIRFNL